MKAAVDRIEETIAVLISCEDESVRLNLPVSLLPPGTSEGDIVSLSIGRDEEATHAAKERVAGLIGKLAGGK
ncbi:DUF3006 domain-containing protein [Methanoregula sp.]|uniref:DUF3006 domain-containing protein n=1 Tax=Methanoregula sp. TaxID=2052170 RepID=UPI0035637E1A